MIQVDDKYVKIRPRRGAYSYWRSKNPVLLPGELALEYPDSGDISSGNVKFKVGDGETDWNHLNYCSINAAVATSITGGDVSSTNLIAIKRGTTSEWESSNPVLQLGEIVYDITKGEIKVGDGINRFTDLRYVGQTWESNKIYDFGNYDNDENI